MTRRIERVESLIRAELSELLQRQVKDPRLGSLITVNEVVVSPDLRYAKVYVSHIGTKEEREKTIAACVAASGFLRHALAKNLRLRRVPELSFCWDESIERGARIIELLDQINSEKPPPPKTK